MLDFDKELQTLILDLLLSELRNKDSKYFSQGDTATRCLNLIEWMESNIHEVNL